MSQAPPAGDPQIDSRTRILLMTVRKCLIEITKALEKYLGL